MFQLILNPLTGFIACYVVYLITGSPIWALVCAPVAWALSVILDLP